jgi:hypothetical protein
MATVRLRPPAGGLRRWAAPRTYWNRTFTNGIPTNHSSRSKPSYLGARFCLTSRQNQIPKSQSALRQQTTPCPGSTPLAGPKIPNKKRKQQSKAPAFHIVHVVISHRRPEGLRAAETRQTNTRRPWHGRKETETPPPSSQTARYTLPSLPTPRKRQSGRIPERARIMSPSIYPSRVTTVF